MVIKCGVCGGMMEIPDDAADEQRFKCPFCGEKTAYRKPMRIDIPIAADKRSAKPKIVSIADATSAMASLITAERRPKSPLSWKAAESLAV